jgi:hypothetical protein
MGRRDVAAGDRGAGLTARRSLGRENPRALLPELPPGFWWRGLFGQAAATTFPVCLADVRVQIVHRKSPLDALERAAEERLAGQMGQVNGRTQWVV